MVHAAAALPRVGAVPMHRNGSSLGEELWHAICEWCRSSIHLREPRRSMYAETIDAFIKTAERKIAAMRESPLGFFVASMLAGAYVGIGIILIFSIGNQTPPEFQKLVMGATFGIALTLVVIAGAELFTGHTMFMALRGYRGIGTLGDVGASWAMTWTGNLAGSLGLVALFALGGGGGLLSARFP